MEALTKGLVMVGDMQGDVELVDGEVLHADAVASLPHPGEEVVVDPVEEVLGVRELTDSEPSADELDVTEETMELPTPDDDAVEEREVNLDDDNVLHRTVLQQDLEVRFELLDEERVALDALENPRK